MSKVTAQVLATVNGPYRTRRSAQQLAALIADPSSAPAHNAAAFAFFSEIAPDAQLAFIAEMNVDVAKVKAVARQFADMAGYPLPLAP
ncbi:MAG: hypothetical protein V2I43_08090 [Parvularcula sp.]|jgi:hypothetical protein|nr:hypothetical protein [Parvularcula sp.]